MRPIGGFAGWVGCDGGWTGGPLQRSASVRGWWRRKHSVDRCGRKRRRFLYFSEWFGPGKPAPCPLCKFEHWIPFERFQRSSGLAVDASGNLFVLDSGTGTIDEILAVNGSIPATVSPTI